MTQSRRRFLQRIGSASAAAALWRLGPVAAAGSGLTVTELGDGLSVVTGAGGNVVVLARPEGLLLVDSGSAERAADLLALLGRRFGTAPIGVLFNTHWHLEHTGGNDAIAARGAKTIVAHENTRLWMSTKYYVEWEDRYYQRARDRRCRPNKTFYSSDPQPIELAFGGERVEYGQLTEAHTDGDIYVYFRERNVIVAGGAVTAARYPVIDYSRAAGSAASSRRRRNCSSITNANTLDRSRRRPAQPRAHLEAQLEMLKTVRGRIENLMRKGKSIPEMLAADVTAGFDPRGARTASGSSRTSTTACGGRGGSVTLYRRATATPALRGVRDAGGPWLAGCSEPPPAQARGGPLADVRPVLRGLPQRHRARRRICRSRN